MSEKTDAKRYCKSAKDFHSFEEIGLPKEYDNLFLDYVALDTGRNNCTMEDVINFLRRTCYGYEEEATDYDSDSAYFVDAIDALFKNGYIRSDFEGIRSSLKFDGFDIQNQLFWPIDEFIDEQYETISPGAFLRPGVIEKELRSILAPPQYNVMQQCQWPYYDDFDPDRHFEYLRDIEKVTMKKAFQNLKECWTRERIFAMMDRALVNE